MAQIPIETTQWPIAVARFPASWSFEEYSALTAGFASLLDRKERFALISDTRGAGIPTARERRLAAEFFRQRETDLRKFLAGWAVLAESTLARGAVTAITWLQSPPFQSAAFATMPEADAWCRDRLGLR